MSRPNQRRYVRTLPRAPRPYRRRSAGAISEYALGAPALPTYRTVAGVLEKKTGSGAALAGWTFLRGVFLIGLPFLIVGTPWRKVVAGAALSSSLMSLFTLLRIFNAREEIRREMIRAELPRVPNWARRRLRGAGFRPTED